MPLEVELESEFQSQDFEAERGMRVLSVKTLIPSACVFALFCYRGPTRAWLCLRRDVAGPSTVPEK